MSKVIQRIDGPNGATFRVRDNAGTTEISGDGTNWIDVTELNYLDGLTATTAELNQLDGTIITDMTPGTGISTGTGTICEHSVTKIGGIFRTEILVDMTGLNSGGGILDVIGKDGGTANCHIGQITAAVNGTILGITMEGLEAPAGGDPDINLYSADEGTLAQDTAISAATNEVILINGGDVTASSRTVATLYPSDNQYLYLVSGAVTDADYTAGRILITLWGV